jgi:transcriptional regulator with XRE-family HTH domain
MESSRKQGLYSVMNIHARPVGEHLKDWRQRRRLSQLDLACEAQISARHLSFVETGRSLPSREMILHLSEQLNIPVRERNVLLVAAGFAPIFPERTLADPALETARRTIDLVLETQKPYPAFAIDRHWNLLATNAAIPELYIGVSEELLRPPVNGLRLSLHPEGLAPRTVNFVEWRGHLLGRLRHEIELTADPKMIDLLAEVSSYPVPQGADTSRHGIDNPIMTPFQIRIEAGLLSFYSTTTVFGTPVDITLSELAIESFFPADAATAEIVKRLAKNAV